MSKTYREHLINAINDLVEILMKLDENIVNLAMSGEFSEIDALFEIGETLNTNVSDFESVEDPNVKRLIYIYYATFELYHHLKNINGISNEEMQESDNSNFPF